MRVKLTVAGACAALVLAGAAAPATGDPGEQGGSPTDGEGLTHFTLMSAGWDCFSPAPAVDPDFNGLVHCTNGLEGFLAGTAVSIRFLTFDTTDITVAGSLLGTERGLRGDIYEHGGDRPCNTDPDDVAPYDGNWSHIEWLFGLDYYMCHSFDSPW